jgi:hypothetical protein
MHAMNENYIFLIRESIGNELRRLRHMAKQIFGRLVSDVDAKVPESLVDCCSVVESCGYDVGAADPVENVDGSSRFVVSYVEPAG